METPESAQSQDLEQRNEQLQEHIDEAERASQRRREITGQTPAGDVDDPDDAAGGQDPTGAVEESDSR